MDEKKIHPYLKQIGVVLAIVIVLWITIRSCSSRNDYLSTEYTIVRDGTWYPISLGGKEKNMLGFTNELVLKIAAKENFKVQLFNKGYTGLFQGLDNGDYDAIISSLVPSSANKSRYLFSDPIYLIGPVLVVRKGYMIKSLDQLAGQTIAFRRGDNIDIDFNRYPNVFMNVYDSYGKAVEALIDNKVDAILMEAIPAYNTIQGYYSGKMVVATAPMNDSGLRIVSLKSARGKRLIDAFNKGLAEMREDGSFKSLLLSWQLIDTEAPPHLKLSPPAP